MSGTAVSAAQMGALVFQAAQARRPISIDHIYMVKDEIDGAANSTLRHYWLPLASRLRK